MKQEHNWSLHEIESLIPWERDVYYAQVNAWVAKKNEALRNKQ